MPPIKHKYISGRNWALFQWMDIPSKVDHGQVYLRRLRVVLTPAFGIYIHWIYEYDADRDPHDHPRPFTAVILRGGYQEVVYPYIHVHRDFATQTRAWYRWSIHKMPLDWAHKITQVLPGTVSLLFVGPKRSRDWGFYTADGFVPNREYGSVQRILREQGLDK